MPEISIENTTFERLQRHAQPLVDTSDSIINRALDSLEEQSGAPIRADSTGTAREIDPSNLPKLTHTKVLSAYIGDKEVAKPNWNRLLDQMMQYTMNVLDDFDQLRKLYPVNMVEGRKDDDGYRYISKINISVQGQDSNSACRAIVSAAQGLGIALDVTFMWRHKEAAAYPGKRARLQVRA